MEAKAHPYRKPHVKRALPALSERPTLREVESVCRAIESMQANDSLKRAHANTDGVERQRLLTNLRLAAGSIGVMAEGTQARAKGAAGDSGWRVAQDALSWMMAGVIGLALLSLLVRGNRESAGEVFVGAMSVVFWLLVAGVFFAVAAVLGNASRRRKTARKLTPRVARLIEVLERLETSASTQ